MSNSPEIYWNGTVPPKPYLQNGKVQNWREIKSWGYFNDTLWNNIEKYFNNLDEAEKLKMLAAAQLRIIHEQEAKILKLISLAPVQVQLPEA